MTQLSLILILLLLLIKWWLVILLMVILTLSLSVVNVKKIMIIILFHDVRNVVG